MVATAWKLQYRQFYQTWTTLCCYVKSKKQHNNPVYLSAVAHRGFLQSGDTSQLMLLAWIRSLGCYQQNLEIIPCQVRVCIETSALRHHTAFKVRHGVVTSSYVFSCISWKCWIWRARFECDRSKVCLIIKFVFSPLFSGWISEVNPTDFFFKIQKQKQKQKHSILHLRLTCLGFHWESHTILS